MCAETLRNLLAAKPIVSAVGVYDALSAWIASQAGFPAVFVSGSAMAYAQLARPDVNLLSATEVADTVARIRDRVTVPIVVDADAGYGNAVNVQRTVRALERAGASAIQIEDQLNHKPVDALATRPLVPLSEMIGKLKAAQDARVNPATLISARTDAVFTAGVEEAFARAEAFVGAGADMVFVEGLTRVADLQRLTATFGPRVPILHNIVDGGTSPIHTAAEAQALGYSIVLFPGVAVQAAATAMDIALRSLASTGRSAAAGAEHLDARGLNALLGTPAFIEAARKYVR